MLNLVKLVTHNICYHYVKTAHCLRKIISVKTLTEYVGQNTLCCPLRINNICDANRENCKNALILNEQLAPGKTNEDVTVEMLEKID